MDCSHTSDTWEAWQAPPAWCCGVDLGHTLSSRRKSIGAPKAGERSEPVAKSGFLSSCSAGRFHFQRLSHLVDERSQLCIEPHQREWIQILAQTQPRWSRGTTSGRGCMSLEALGSVGTQFSQPLGLARAIRHRCQGQMTGYQFSQRGAWREASRWNLMQGRCK